MQTISEVFMGYAELPIFQHKNYHPFRTHEKKTIEKHKHRLIQQSWSYNTENDDYNNSKMFNCECKFV